MHCIDGVTSSTCEATSKVELELDARNASCSPSLSISLPANDSDDDNEMEMCAPSPFFLHGGDIEQTKQRNHQRRENASFEHNRVILRQNVRVLAHHAAFFPKPPILPEMLFSRPFPINQS